MFAVTGLEFAFTQAPDSMKSLLLAFWSVSRPSLKFSGLNPIHSRFSQLTIACGDLIVTLIVGASVLDDQAMEFLLFAVLMFVDMLVFMWLARNYKSINNSVEL